MGKTSNTTPPAGAESVATLHARWRARLDRLDLIPGVPNANRERRFEDVQAIEKAVAGTPARTHGEIILKLRMVESGRLTGMEDGQILASAITDLDALSDASRQGRSMTKTTPAENRPFTTAYDQWRRLGEQFDKDGNDALLAKIEAAEMDMARAPALTVAEAAAKALLSSAKEAEGPHPVSPEPARVMAESLQADLARLGHSTPIPAP